jgi:hypothetical protein
MAVYKITTSKGTRLVQADTKIGAIKHVMISEVTAEALNTNQLADAIGEGLTLEKAVFQVAATSQDTEDMPL